MLIIKNQSLNEIFQELSELSLERKELGILIENLPPEIDGDVSLSHLIFTLRNYPRKLVWFTDNQKVFELFYRNKIPIYKFHSKVNKVDAITLELNRQATQQANNNTLIDFSTSNQNYFNQSEIVEVAPETTTNHTQTQSNPTDHAIVIGEASAIDLPVVENYIEPKPQGQIALKNESQQLDSAINLSTSGSAELAPKTTDNFNNFILVESEPSSGNSIPEDHYKSTQEDQSLTSKTHSTVSLQPSFNRKDGIIHEVNNNTILHHQLDRSDFSLDQQSYRVNMVHLPDDTPDEENQTASDNLTRELDFKKLRNKIMASKEVLESINRANTQNSPNKYFNLVDSQLDHIKQLSEQQKLNSDKQSKSLNSAINPFFNWRTLNIFAYSLLVIVISTGIAIGFPTVAYTIEVQPERKEGQGIFQFERAALRKQNYKFTLNARGEATGTVNLESTRAKGQIRLLNKSGNEINLDSDSFYFEVGGKRYNPVFDGTQIRNVSVPAKNHIGGPVVTLTIESSLAGTGNEFNLAEGTELTPRNLKGVPIGPNFVAVVSQEVIGNIQTGSKSVTDADIRAVRSQIESSLSQEKELKVRELESTKEYISNSVWSVNVESEYNTDHKVGDVSDDISITANISADIYYISLKDLSDKILDTETEADQVIRTVINNSDKAWSQEAQKLSLETKYVVKLRTEISPQKLRQIAEGNGLNTDKASSDIKNTYSDVAIVRPQIKGIAVPGISPRIQIEVIQRNFSE